MDSSRICKVQKMKVVLGSVVLLAAVLCAVLAAVNPGTDDKKQLLLVHVIMRHGARTPASTYPKDPYINETFYPFGWGQLTNRGKMDLYETGKYLRERYNSFLGERYTPNVFYTQSTDVDRTKASMQVVNAGLWPPKGDQIWGPIPWQPIPVHSEPLDEDMLLLVRKPCAQYSLEMEKAKELPEVKKKLEEFRPLFQSVSKHTGAKMEDFADAEDIYSTLVAEKSYNLSLPEWTKEFFPEPLEKPTIFFYVFNSYTEKMKRLKGGVLLHKLIEDWKAKSRGTLEPQERKAFLYGGHDSTIANLLSALNVWDPQIPAYGITIMLEMSRDISSGEIGIEIYLRNTTDSSPHLLKVPGCQTFCPLDKLIDLTKPVIPQNWQEECKSDDPNYTPPPPSGP
ncbi:prostatic acid phosphatase-like isoform X2 [Coccinella septempunctata]|uniref:prostatic acid phosphatase-like isoform X2 n=1 Tax=Coccinella septempunctata TaxID=41139 RepID=UPI001D076B58|nr:prostatic acid phosphatase-like isoform X2 [Coccinella septempunctata]